MDGCLGPVFSKPVLSPHFKEILEPLIFQLARIGAVAIKRFVNPASPFPCTIQRFFDAFLCVSWNFRLLRDLRKRLTNYLEDKLSCRQALNPKPYTALHAGLNTFCHQLGEAGEWVLLSWSCAVSQSKGQILE